MLLTYNWYDERRDCHTLSKLVILCNLSHAVELYSNFDAFSFFEIGYNLCLFLPWEIQGFRGRGSFGSGLTFYICCSMS